jgi:hypothetical protein
MGKLQLLMISTAMILVLATLTMGDAEAAQVGYLCPPGMQVGSVCAMNCPPFCAMESDASPNNSDSPN